MKKTRSFKERLSRAKKESSFKSVVRDWVNSNKSNFKAMHLYSWNLEPTVEMFVEGLKNFYLDERFEEFFPKERAYVIKFLKKHKEKLPSITNCFSCADRLKRLIDSE